MHRTFSPYTDPRKDPLRKQGFLGSGKAGWAQEVPECDSELWRDPRVPSAGAVAWTKSQNLRLQRAAAPPHVGEGTGTAQGGWIPCSGHAWRLCLAPLPGAALVWESAGTDNAPSAEMNRGILQPGCGAERAEPSVWFRQGGPGQLRNACDDVCAHPVPQPKPLKEHKPSKGTEELSCPKVLLVSRFLWAAGRSRSSKSRGV